MSKHAPSRWKCWIALAATYLLVLQVLVIGLAGGTFANALSLDRALAVTLCLPGSDAPPEGEAGEPKAHGDPSCCTAGCPMTAADAPPKPSVATRADEPRDLETEPLRAECGSDLRAGRASYASRAPPILG